MGKYYVAGIPFDSENSLKHYGVKGMEWNKHKFGIDADDRYIKWLDPNKVNVGSYGKYGKMAEAAAKQKYGANAPTPKGKLAPVYNKQQVMDSYNRNKFRKDAQNLVNNATKQVVYNYKRNRFQNNAQNLVNNAANNINQRITTARAEQQKRAEREKWNNSPIGKAANFVGQTAQNVGGAVSGAARDVGNWANQQVQNVANSAPVQAAGKFVDKNITGNTARTAAEGYRQLANGTNSPLIEQAAQRAQERADNTLFGRVGNAANAVGDWIGERASEVANSAPVKAVGNFVDQNITGNTDRNAAQAYQQMADDFGNNQYAQKAERAQEQADNSLFGRIGNAANAVGDWVGDRARDVGNFVNGNPAQSVDNTAEQARGGVGGFFDRIGDTVGGAANAVGDWAGNAFRDFGNLNSAAAETSTPNQNASNAADQSRGGIGGFFDRVGNAVGGAANAVGDWAGNAVQDVSGAVQNAGDWIGDRARDVGGAVSGAAGNVGDLAGQAGQWIGNQARDIGGAVSGAAQNVGNFITGDQARQNLQDAQNSFFLGRGARVDAAQNAYNQTLPGMVGNAVNQVGDWTRGAAGNVGNWAGRAARDAGSAVSGAAGNVGNWAGQAASNIGNWAGQAAKNVGNAVGQAGQWLGNVPNAIGQIIPEQLIPEQLIPEQLIREKLYHSAINEKPDGVSDAFWEKFTADGGTREEYERDWR